ncbi:acyl carrier protein [Bacteroides propionicifaciens]|uniref:acyl carrier protein n=1 Tax=Bacteroides propionicifaciens TaxID=392838 RepID=UPI0003721FC0|nr:acyl carrier protein [Bacteroides propionicifaciens]
MNNEQIIENIREVLAEEFEVDIDTIQPEAPLQATLELDSLDLVDMVVLIEKNFGFTLTTTDFQEVKTFQDLYSLIIKKVSEKES